MHSDHDGSSRISNQVWIYIGLVSDRRSANAPNVKTAALVKDSANASSALLRPENKSFLLHTTANVSRDQSVHFGHCGHFASCPTHLPLIPPALLSAEVVNCSPTNGNPYIWAYMLASDLFIDRIQICAVFCTQPNMRVSEV